MSEQSKDGGPAFPQADLSAYGMGPSEVSNGGMSLRDFFAAHALPAAISMAMNPRATFKTAGPLTEKDFAQQAYHFADAMLAARAAASSQAA